MATHAHSTRTPLLPPSGRTQPLLDQGARHTGVSAQLGPKVVRQLGPVTHALAAMHAADPDLDRQRLRDLRRRIADRIEADIALLDALSPDADLEDGHDAEGLTDDNGIGDYDAIGEQGFRGYGGCL